LASNLDYSPKNSTSWESLRSVHCEQGEKKVTEVYFACRSTLQIYQLIEQILLPF